jgi:hypothetical protein|tara:strand:- start:907 stop:2493 length:1587 start_codon:yes stop_codon:yes gene_type:complete
MSDIKKAIQREYVKCVENPTHFLQKYAVIQHPQKGKIKFDLYDFQSKTLEELRKNQYNIILKSRQLGISTLSAGYSLWLLLFFQDKNILVIAKDKGAAKNLVTKVRVMYHNLPSWLKTKVDEDNKLSFRLANGSQIKAVAATPEAGRSEALSMLVLDEAAFIPAVETIWTAAQQTLATGGQCVVLSTPNGVGNWFHKMWVDAIDGINDFAFIELPWQLHPDRDQTWRDDQEKALGPTKAAQECDANFLTSGNSIIDPLILQWYKETMVKEPMEQAGVDKNLWIWNYPDYTKEYIVVADVARGDGTDYSATQVFEIESLDQVAEYKGQLSTTDYGNFLIELATKYNDALLIVENNNVGWATLQTIIDRGYKNLFYQSKDLQYVDTEHQMASNRYRSQDRNMIPGFTTSKKTRPLVVAKMEEYTREKMVNIKSSRLVEELFVFIYYNNKAEAMSGYNDDLVMSYGIALWIRDTALRLKKENDDYQRQMLGSFLNNNNGYDEGFGMNEVKPKDNPWEVEIAGEKENLNWLL